MISLRLSCHMKIVTFFLFSALCGFNACSICSCRVFGHFLFVYNKLLIPENLDTLPRCSWLTHSNRCDAFEHDSVKIRNYLISGNFLNLLAVLLYSAMSMNILGVVLMGLWNHGNRTDGTMELCIKFFYLRTNIHEVKGNVIADRSWHEHLTFNSIMR